jgi:uncharacterized protein DUF5670
VPLKLISEAGFQSKGFIEMFWAVLAILLMLSLVGFARNHTQGEFILVLLVAALVLLIFQLISGRRGAA